MSCNPSLTRALRMAIVAGLLLLLLCAVLGSVGHVVHPLGRTDSAGSPRPAKSPSGAMLSTSAPH